MNVRMIRVGDRIIWDKCSGSPMPKILTLNIEFVRVVEPTSKTLDGVLSEEDYERALKRLEKDVADKTMELVEMERILHTERAMKEGCQKHLLAIAEYLDKTGVGVAEDEPTSERVIRAMVDLRALVNKLMLGGQ